MEKTSKKVVMEHDPGQPAPFVFPYSKSEYPYVLVLGLSRPLTAGNIGLLFSKISERNSFFFCIQNVSLAKRLHG